MAFGDVIAQIDAEISRLQQARELLSGLPALQKPGRGRPKGSKNAVIVEESAEAPIKGKRKLSEAGRKAIADAMRRRWAERRKEVAK